MTEHPDKFFQGKEEAYTPDTQHAMGTRVKVVADMPGDDEMREELETMKKNDGYPGSCGI
jgi:hypothetical protein